MILEQNIVPDSFCFLQSIRKKVEITKEKILFPYKSGLSTSILVTIFLCPSILFSLLRFFFNQRDFEHLLEKNLIYIVILEIITGIIIYLAHIKLYKIIDFSNNTFYSQIIIYDREYRFNTFKVEDVLYVCNNVKIPFNIPGNSGYYEGKPIKVNKNTQKFHNYYVSFLLKSGKLINFSLFGIFEEDYKDSINLATNLSDYFDIPLFTCKDDRTLKVIGNDITNFYLEDINLVEDSTIKGLKIMLIMIIIAVALLFFFTFGLVSLHK